MASRFGEMASIFLAQFGVMGEGVTTRHPGLRLFFFLKKCIYFLTESFKNVGVFSPPKIHALEVWILRCISIVPHLMKNVLLNSLLPIPATWGLWHWLLSIYFHELLLGAAASGQKGFGPLCPCAGASCASTLPLSPLPSPAEPAQAEQDKRCSALG